MLTRLGEHRGVRLGKPWPKTDPGVAAGAGKIASRSSAGDAAPATAAAPASRERKPRRSKPAAASSCEEESLDMVVLRVLRRAAVGGGRPNMGTRSRERKVTSIDRCASPAAHSLSHHCLLYTSPSPRDS